MGRDITGEINFYSHTTDGSAPWMDATPKLGWTATNYAHTPARATIHDLRGKEDSVDLDTNGFEILKYDGRVHDVFDDNSEQQKLYYDDIANILKKRLGASRVIVFNHIFRFRGPPRPADQCTATHKNPLSYPHVDDDPIAAHAKMEEILGEEEAKKVGQKRFQIINVWRPVGPNPIINTPLTLCDYRTLDTDHNLHVSEVRGTTATIAIYLISRNNEDAQKWYYMSEMRSNEMFVFKIFDRNPDVAQFGAHTAFKNENAPPSDVEQVSLEIRTLVIYDE